MVWNLRCHEILRCKNSYVARILTWHVVWNEILCDTKSYVPRNLCAKESYVTRNLTRHKLRFEYQSAKSFDHHLFVWKIATASVILAAGVSHCMIKTIAGTTHARTHGPPACTRGSKQWHSSWHPNRLSPQNTAIHHWMRAARSLHAFAFIIVSITTHHDFPYCGGNGCSIFMVTFSTYQSHFIVIIRVVNVGHSRRMVTFRPIWGGSIRR